MEVTEGQRKNSPAAKFAHKYIEKVNRPLKEDDLTVAFNEGMKYGRSSAWHRVDEQTPSPKASSEQIAVLFEVAAHTYDMTVVSSEEYTACITNRDRGIPLFWCYLRALFVHRIKFPKFEKEIK